MDEGRRASTWCCIADLAPEPTSDGKIAVSLWLGRDPRIAIAQPAAREVA